MNLCIDLCSGRGGFSRAFVEAGWEVITVDNDWKFKPTIVSDVTRLTSKEIEAKTKLGSFGKYEKVVVLASPPCERFSLANMHWPQRGIRKALELVGACIELIIDIGPHYWCLENPKGRLTWFLGKPPHCVRLSDYGYKVRMTQGRRPLGQVFKRTALWSNFPFPLLDAEKIVNKTKGPSWSHREQRAELPYGLSKAILEAVTRKEAPLVEVE